MRPSHSFRAPVPAVPAPSAGSLLDSPALLWLLVALGLWVLYPLSGLRAVVGHLDLPDTDDAMRLVQVRDLLAGQGWFDLNQARLMPPAGVPLHWSRLVDAPLAGLIGLATPWLGRPLAEGLVAALWPPVLFGLYLALVFRAVRARFGTRAAILSLFSAAHAVGLGSLFAFGRIDHHNVQVLLILALGLALAEPGRTARWAALGGVAAALSLAVGLEALPFIALAGVFLLLDWILAGPAALPALRGFALALAGASLVLFAGQTAPALWPAARCDALSPPWLWLVLAGAALATGAKALGPRLDSQTRRAAFAAACGTAGIGGFLVLAPQCLSGPFHDLPAGVRAAWLDRVVEMQPLHRLLRSLPGDALAYTMPVLLAGLLAARTALRGAPGLRRAAILATVFLLAGVGLSLFQARGLYVAVGILPLVVGPLLDRAIGLLNRPVPAWRAGAPALVLALLLWGHVWAALAAALTGGAPVTDRTLLDDRACLGAAALSALATVPPGTILAPVDLGPALLLRTRHAVVAAPYHRAIAGLTASVTGLTGDAADLRRALAGTGATYLALCAGGSPGEAPGKASEEAPGKDLQEAPGKAPQDSSGKAPRDSPDAAAPFARRLAGGTATAPWLERLTPADAPLALWRVR